MQFTTWIEALDRYKQLNPSLTDEQVGERLGCSRTTTVKARSRASRDELPAHAKLLLIEALGISWSRDLALAVLPPTARKKAERALASAGPQQPPPPALGIVDPRARSRAGEFVFNLLPLLHLRSDDVGLVWAQLRLAELLSLLADCDASGLARSALKSVRREFTQNLGDTNGQISISPPQATAIAGEATGAA